MARIPRTANTFRYFQAGNNVYIHTSGKNGSGVTTIRKIEIDAGTQDIHVRSIFKPDARSAEHKTEARQILLATLNRLSEDTGRKVVLHFRFPGGKDRNVVGDVNASPRKTETPLLPADQADPLPGR